MSNLHIIQRLTVTSIRLSYQFEPPFYTAGYISELLHTNIESTFKKIDNQLKKEGIKHPSFFRSNLSKDQLKLHPKLKDYANPPRGYSFYFTIDTHRSLLFVDISLFGWFKEVLLHLLPLLPGLFARKTIPQMKFVSISDGYGRRFDSVDKFWNVPPAIFTLDYFQQAKLRGKTLKIMFNSPLMLRHDQNQVGTVRLYDLLGALTRRASVLSFVYSGGAVPDFDSFYNTEMEKINIESLQIRWNKWDIPAKSEKNAFSVSGYTGYVNFHSESHNKILQQYLPLLLFGEHIQVGDKTNYGGGKYSIANECYTFI